MSKNVIATLLVSLFALSDVIAQGLVVNEMISNNLLTKDEYGEFSDWMELFNAGTDTVRLSQYRLADKNDFDSGWELGDISLAPVKHLQIFASGNDKKEKLSYETIITRGDQYKYAIAVPSIPASWKDINFNDASWSSGSSGFGYGDNDDNTVLQTGTTTVLLRRKFEISDISKIKELLLHVDYDDAFVAYINGKEVARANIGVAGQSVAYTDIPFTDHEAQMYNGGSPDVFAILDVENYLKTGANILCLQGHNISSSSSDFSLIPYLTIGKNDGSASFIAPGLKIDEGNLHASFKIGGDENVYLFDPNGNLVDSLPSPGKLPPNISVGRKTDGNPSIVLFEAPTPGKSNGGVFYYGVNNEEIVFSKKAGLYEQGFNLELSGHTNIRFTVDGTEPTAISNRYSNPIFVSKNTIVRAKIFQNDYLPGEVFDQNYLIGARHYLPIVSLYTEPKLLFDLNIGMYVLGTSHSNTYPFEGANFWEDWEYPFNFQYYDEQGMLKIDGTCGAKIFGGWSRANEQRSFSLFARSEYGMKDFAYPFFKNRKYDKFESIVLRNSGNDWARSMMRDALMTGLLSETTLDYQAYQPAAAYLNGEYWGLYNIREKINEHFLADLHGLDSDDIDLLEGNGSLIHGNNADFLSLRTFIENNSMASAANYNQLLSLIDETNFIQYNAAQIYYNNTDWPGNNLKYWKKKGGKWRWILFDTDFGLGVYEASDYLLNTLNFALETSGPNWPNPPWSTLFLRKFLENDQFKRKFINYFADLMNTAFLPQKTHAHIDSLSARIFYELPKHFNKWEGDMSNWSSHIYTIKNFFNLRPAIMRNFIKQRFSLPNQYTLNVAIDGPEKGSVQLNSIRLNNATWSGIYFQNNPVVLTAIARPGYKFIKWTGAIESISQSIDLNVNQTKNIVAHFEEDASSVQAIVINEINYNSSDEMDPDDWIELYNRSSQTIDLSSWVVKDNDDSHGFVFPVGTQIKPGEFFIVSSDVSQFRKVFPEVKNVFGDLGFKLSSGGDQVRLYDPIGFLQDSVSFGSNAPWPIQANGQGPTLELMDPFTDNNIPQNWGAFDGNGSPGKANNTITAIDEQSKEIVISISPNPASLVAKIDAKGMQIQDVVIYDDQGKLVNKLKGNVELLDLSHMKSGIYFVVINDVEGRVFNQKLFKI